MIQSSEHLKLLSTLTLIYGGLLLYASLMPYDFVRGTDIGLFTQSRVWNHWPFNSQARVSGSDLLSNLILYIPLGALVATRCRFTAMNRGLILVLTTLLCSGLSLGVEVLQGATVSRTPSAADWLFNSISGLLGASAGVMIGRPCWVKCTDWITSRWQKHPLDILTLAFLGLLAADNLSPFLPTILLSQVWRNLKNSHFGIIEGFAQHSWHWWLVNHVLLYMILTFLLTAWGSPSDRPQNRWQPFLLSIIFVLTLEAVKPMIVSRTINLANIATAALGAGLAMGLKPLLATRVSRRRKLELALLTLLSFGFYLSWTPFNFSWDPELFQRRIPVMRELLPLYHYAMGASLNHVRLFVQVILLQGMLIYLARIRFNWLLRCRFQLILAAVLTGFLGLLQEGGQMFLPSRTPSMTDVYCCMLGGVLGAWLPLHRNHQESSTP